MFMVLLSRTLVVPAPEPAPTANAVTLNEHETSGPLPVGFEFERFGVQYDRFDLSTDGFVRFGSEGYRSSGEGCVSLEIGGRGSLGRGRLAYEVRGSAPRRRLVVSFAGQGARRAALQVVVYERTGMVGVRDGSDQSLGEPTIRQLDIAQPPASRANSARNIG